MARAPFDLHDAATLHDLVSSAGFRSVRVRPTVIALSVDFVPGHLSALPIAHAIAQLADEHRTALLGDIAEALRSYVDGDRLTVPAGPHVVTADA